MLRCQLQSVHRRTHCVQKGTTLWGNMLSANMPANVLYVYFQHSQWPVFTLRNILQVNYNVFKAKRMLMEHRETLSPLPQQNLFQ
jgi:hypothetical protein